MNPPILAPNRQGLTRIHAKVVKFCIMLLVAELGFLEPIGRKLFAAIGHVFPSKYTELQHLFWRELWLESLIEILAYRFGADILPSLHCIFHDDGTESFHRFIREYQCVE